MLNMRRSAIFRGILVAMVVSLGAGLPLKAATVTWDGSSFNNEWQNGLNWSGGNAGVDDDLVFPFFAAQKDNHNGFSANTRFHSILFGAFDYSVTGNQIQLTAGIVFNPAGIGADVQFTPNILLAADQTFDCSSVHLNGFINLNGHTLTSAGGIYEASINGTGTLIVKSVETVINGNSSGFGATEVNGLLVVNSAGILGAINLNAANLLSLSSGTLIGSWTVGAITVDPANGGRISPGLSN